MEYFHEVFFFFNWASRCSSAKEKEVTLWLYLAGCRREVPRSLWPNAPARDSPPHTLSTLTPQSPHPSFSPLLPSHQSSTQHTIKSLSLSLSLSFPRFHHQARSCFLSFSHPSYCIVVCCASTKDVVVVVDDDDAEGLRFKCYWTDSIFAFTCVDLPAV